MEYLPEDCFAHILSFTSPLDVCRTSLISSVVKSMADSDTVWAKFLPHNYQQIVSRLVGPSFPCSTEKELFFRLCKPQPIDDGNKMFSVEKTTGKICYSLSARQLSISYGNNHLYWSWKHVQGSRFTEAAELRTICWLEIKGSINTEILSPKTIYGAYLKIKIVDRAYGLDTLPSEVSIEFGNYKSQRNVYICKTNGKVSCNCYSVQKHYGDDEWLEIELGSFYTESVQELRLCLKEVKGVHLKGGLIVDGIELRPKACGL
ncbi:F-box protein PP2-B15-like [Cicer arietinum]|uniref:F-box protein PP2-B15-like isoform X2 n=1 Tax=Cicer arietinum TaxID=3827 RepID=A0A1S2XU48_CICAR|nr:F-box protein PP2-B15-like isoform X2 [Cicer arietinum]